MSKPAPRVTVAHVARSANVALGTVSRVLNNFADVTPEVRERVICAAQELGYTRLRRRKLAASAGTATDGGAVFGMLCFGMEDTLVHVPVVSAAIQGIESALGESNGNMMLANIPNGDRVPTFLQGNGIAGVILKGPNQGELPPPSRSELLSRVLRLPHVWLMGRLPNASGDHCNFDTDEAGRLAVEHLAERGHRRIAFLNPKPGHTQFEKVKRAMLDCGRRIDCDVQLLESDPITQLAWPLPAITSENAVEKLVGRWRAEPARRRATVLFAPSDRTAVQAYSALDRLGVAPGRDVGVLSCNNEPSVTMGLGPELSTIDVHAEMIGRRAVELLKWRIAHPFDSTSVQLLVQPTLVARDSVPKI